MQLIVAVALGGALGAVARYLLMGQVEHLAGNEFPWSTLVVNVLGAFLLGVLLEIFALAWSPSPELRAMLVVGVLGAFTTFSTYALDMVFLIERGAWLPALLYSGASVLLTVAGLIAGMRLFRLLLV